jgi:hypothetical protein
MTQAYRCYLLDEDHHIAAVEVIECRDDRDAKRRAEEILAAQPVFSGAELWDRDRRVDVHSSTESPSADQKAAGFPAE